MSNALNYAAEYSAALSQNWGSALYFGALYSSPTNSRFRFTSGHTVELPIISTTGRVDADRDSIAVAARNYENSWETKELTNHRKWSTLVHPLDIRETSGAASIENITSVYNAEQKFPEMDAYCVSKLYTDWTAGGGTPVTTALTEENILSVFDELMEDMTEARVPTRGRVLYVTPAAMTLLKNASAVSRTVDVAVEGSGIERTVSSLDGVEVVVVPAVLMKTAYNFTEGWEVAAGAVQINMLLVHPGAVAAPVSYSFAQLDPPSAFTEGKYFYFEESCEDVFILAGKEGGIAFVTGQIS